MLLKLLWKACGVNKVDVRPKNLETEALIEECKRLINEAAEKVFYAKDTDFFETILVDCRDIVFDEYKEYLNLYYLNYPKFTGCTLRSEIRFDAYADILLFISESEKKVITDTLRSFDPNKSNGNSYFGYLFQSVKIQVHKKRKQKEYADKHFGMTGIFSDEKRDKTIMKNILEFVSENTEYNKFTVRDVEILSEKLGISEEKIVDVFNSSQNAYVTSFHLETDENGDEVDISDLTAYNRYIESKGLLNAVSYQEFVELINYLYVNHFTDNCRKFYPPFLSNLIIEVLAEDIGERLKCTPKQVLKNHIEDLDIPAIKYQYADGSCHCIIAIVFDWVLENRKFLLQKYIAKHFNVSESYIAKTIKQVQDMLKKQLNSYC